MRALCGLCLVLLVETADLNCTDQKEAGPIYLTALTAMLVLGLRAVRRPLYLIRQGTGR